jgi:flagellar L-ring protein precursor FlgH
MKNSLQAFPCWRPGRLRDHRADHGNPPADEPAPRGPQPISADQWRHLQRRLARPLFEDRRARFVGDTITISIAEKVQASKKSENKTTRSQAVDVTVPTIAGLPFKGAQGTALSASDTNNFSGKGRTPRPTTSPAPSP